MGISRRGAGTLPEIVDLARRNLGAGNAVYYAPMIPPAKEAGARAVHGAHLPESEPLLVLHDATLLGGADDGFLVTAQRLCWKNLLEHPRQIAWSELEPAAVVAEDSRIGVAGGGIAVSGELIPGMARFLVAMAERYSPRETGPYRSSAAAPPETAEGALIVIARLTALARRHVGEVEAMYYHPAIPAPKLRKARAVHAAHIEADEGVAVLYDDTVFGGAEDGFLITPRRLCWKNLTGEPESAEWEAIEPETVSAGGNLVHVMKGTLQLISNAKLAAPVARLLAAIAAEARSDVRA